MVKRAGKKNIFNKNRSNNRSGNNKPIDFWFYSALVLVIILIASGVFYNYSYLSSGQAFKKTANLNQVIGQTKSSQNAQVGSVVAPLQNYLGGKLYIDSQLKPSDEFGVDQQNYHIYSLKGQLNSDNQIGKILVKIDQKKWLAFMPVASCPVKKVCEINPGDASYIHLTYCDKNACAVALFDKKLYLAHKTELKQISELAAGLYADSFIDKVKSYNQLFAIKCSKDFKSCSFDLPLYVSPGGTYDELDSDVEYDYYYNEQLKELFDSIHTSSSRYTKLANGDVDLAKYTNMDTALKVYVLNMVYDNNPSVDIESIKALLSLQFASLGIDVNDPYVKSQIIIPDATYIKTHADALKQLLAGQTPIIEETAPPINIYDPCYMKDVCSQKQINVIINYGTKEANAYLNSVNNYYIGADDFLSNTGLSFDNSAVTGGCKCSFNFGVTIPPIGSVDTGTTGTDNNGDIEPTGPTITASTDSGDLETVEPKTDFNIDVSGTGDNTQGDNTRIGGNETNRPLDDVCLPSSGTYKLVNVKDGKYTLEVTG